MSQQKIEVRLRDQFSTRKPQSLGWEGLETYLRASGAMAITDEITYLEADETGIKYYVRARTIRALGIRYGLEARRHA